MTTLNRLRVNRNITIKPADKNLGLVVLDTTAYESMCLLHLNDRTTYEIVHDYNPQIIFNKLRHILTKYNKLLHTWQKTSTSKDLTPLASSLLQLENSTTLRVPVFYTIPKIHKTIVNPPGRPIVSSVGSITYHTSVYLDNELQPVLKLLPTICSSSRKLILDMQTFQARNNSVILCADVTALYPNIPIELGIHIVTTVLKELHIFTDKHLEFLMDLLAFILNENYCTFSDVIYHQIKGTAMGTPTAVSYSNIFLYGIEKSMLHKHKYSYYTRYIDDVFAIFDSSLCAQAYVEEFNSFCPSIKFEAVTIDSIGIMLDLELSLITRSNFDIITHKIYQKERNIYQYIPTLSEHKSSLFENFVLQELTRYKLACKQHSDYVTISTAFATRLAARGYPDSVFTIALERVPARYILLRDLLNSRKKSTDPKRGSPIVSLCVPRLDPKIPWSKIFYIPEDITLHTAYTNNFISGKVLIGTKNPPSIGSYIVRSKFSSS